MMRCEFFVLALLVLLSARLMADSGKSDYTITAIPQGYTMQAYDDCGVNGRQPHIDMADCYDFTLATSDTDADLKSRTAVFSYKEIRINYIDLDPKQSYALALTYASDHVYKRVQSLWAGDIELHSPMPLPSAQAIKVYVSVPASAVRDGKLSLTIKIHGEVNATVSIAELWSNGGAKDKLKFNSVTGVPGGLTGRLVSMTFEGTEATQVALKMVKEDRVLATTTTDKDGWFNFDDKLWREKAVTDDMRVEANYQGQEMSETISSSQLSFKPVRYRPIPTAVDGLKSNQFSLDGAWKIDPAPSDSVRENLLVAKSWSDFHVPGQWLQQGFDVPQDKPVALAREFTIPKEWSDYRIFLRFDAIHAGTDYWLNGKKLGYSENLFTPVEWEITDAALPGKANRLDLSMKVETVSEKMSFSSGYAFHSLGGIDRSVRVFALPKVHIKDLRVLTDLDSTYRDAEMKINFTVDNPPPGRMPGGIGLALHISVLGADGKAAKISTSSMPIAALEPGANAIDATIRVTNPLKWSAEKPHLYQLVMELKDDNRVIERIEKSIGFRKIEVKGSLVYVNGQRVKFAGACHHEFDPLTGRADTMRHAEQDVKIAKDSNLNYLRTSHYPPTDEFLEAADRLGMYVEVEAPFCWVSPTSDLADLDKVLTPTSAMVDYCHAHPSVVIWSIANESNFNKFFEFSNKLIKQLDPTRPTTFNNPDPEKICDIYNVHYPLMPYDDVQKDDPRPMFIGEYWFPVCHEQTDVSINPGLRELWGTGHAEPDSDFGKASSKSFEARLLLPGTTPGAWSHIYHSNRVIGGAIWAEIDEPFYFNNGTHVGYAWHHGFWGIYDAWRRPKPEGEFSTFIFSPVWFPVRHVTFSPGQDSITIPVENRYSFTDLKELAFQWEIGKKRGKVKVSAAPAATGEVHIPIPAGTKEGDRVVLRVTDKSGALINVLAIDLGKAKLAPLPQPTAGTPKWVDNGDTVSIEGNGFKLELNRRNGEIVRDISTVPMLSLPSLHVSLHDFGDLSPGSKPYAILPDQKTREIEGIGVGDKGNALEIRIKDHYAGFAGSITWLIDKNGVGKVSYDYTYSGDKLETREIGIRAMLAPQFDQLTWNRWSEWAIFPEDSISRTKGTAKSRRDAKWPDVPERVKPSWPWSLDQTELGTNDFRSVKFNIYDAKLTAPDGSGVKVNANADAHIRACLAKDGVMMHVLKQCPLGPFNVNDGDRLQGEFVISLMGAKAPKR